MNKAPNAPPARDRANYLASCAVDEIAFSSHQGTLASYIIAKYIRMATTEAVVEERQRLMRMLELPTETTNG